MDDHEVFFPDPKDVTGQGDDVVCPECSIGRCENCYGTCTCPHTPAG